MDFVSNGIKHVFNRAGTDIINVQTIRWLIVFSVFMKQDDIDINIFQVDVDMRN